MSTPKDPHSEAAPIGANSIEFDPDETMTKMPYSDWVLEIALFNKNRHYILF
jgi:hypothetical protein